MGHVFAKVTIYGPKGSEEMNLLVDTGSAYSWISRDVLDRLGILPKGTKAFRMMNNQIIEKDYGEAIIECNGERATTIVIFAENDATVFGVYSLEGLALEVDPLQRRLKKTIVHFA